MDAIDIVMLLLALFVLYMVIFHVGRRSPATCSKAKQPNARRTTPTVPDRYRLISKTRENSVPMHHVSDPTRRARVQIDRISANYLYQVQNLTRR
jgi:hypothetical protein